MSKLKNELQTQVSSVDLDALTELVETQLGNVVGGGYSQYGGYHAKDAPKVEEN
jgi:hypothetical protein